MSEKHTTTYTRREILKIGLGVMTALLTPAYLTREGGPRSGNRLALLERLPPPASLGRIISWQQQNVRRDPTLTSTIMTRLGRNTIIPLYATVEGEAPWPSNPIWYQTTQGFVHSAFVQPVEDERQTEVITEVTPPGFWAEVSVPIAEARSRPTAPSIAWRLYYQTVYRVIAAAQDDTGEWWYRIQDGLTWSPGPYVPAWSMRRITPEDLAPISPGHPNKWINIDLRSQMLTCYEDEQAVFATRVASGASKTPTPYGEFRVLYKRHTRRMMGEDYDLSGVPFPVYFTRSAVAIHGTYWHNNYGFRSSHGCVNVPSSAAKWIFRWVEPEAPYAEETVHAAAGTGTRIVVT